MILSYEIDQHKQTAERKGKVLVSATVANSQYRIRSSHKSLTVYLEVDPTWTVKGIGNKARWKYVVRYLENTGIEATRKNIRIHLAKLNKNKALDVMEIHEL